MECHGTCFVDIRPSNTQLFVYNRRVTKDEIFFCLRRSVFVDEFNSPFNEPGSKVLGIGDGGRATDELRFGTIKCTETLQAAQHISQMAPKNTAIGVQF